MDDDEERADGLVCMDTHMVALHSVSAAATALRGAKLT